MVGYAFHSLSIVVVTEVDLELRVCSSSCLDARERTKVRRRREPEAHQSLAERYRNKKSPCPKDPSERKGDKVGFLRVSL